MTSWQFVSYYSLCRLGRLCSVCCVLNGRASHNRGSAGSSRNVPNRHSIVLGDWLRWYLGMGWRGSAGTFAVGVALVAEQAKRSAKRSPGAVAGLSGSRLGTLFVLRSRRVARHIRRRGEGLLRLSRGRGATRASPRPYSAGSFSSGEFSLPASSAGLRCRREGGRSGPLLASPGGGLRGFPRTLGPFRGVLESDEPKIGRNATQMLAVFAGCRVLANGDRAKQRSVVFFPFSFLEGGV